MIVCLLSVSTVKAEYPAKDWDAVASKMQKGWDVQRLARVIEGFERMPTTAFMLVESGAVIESFGKTHLTYPLYEISLAPLSALYGSYQLDEHLSLAQPIKNFSIDEAPPLSDKAKRTTLQSLFQSRHSIDHSAAFDDQPYQKQVDKRYLDLVWRYNQWGFNVLANIYEQLTGTWVSDAFENKIVGPLRMQDYRGIRHSYEIYGIDSQFLAPQFDMSARDLARLGLLFLEQGKWEQTQLLSLEWVKKSTTIQSASAYSLIDGTPAGGFGYLWYVEQDHQLFPGVFLPEGSYAMQGRGGQYLVIIPSMQLVIVHLNDTSFDQAAMTPEMFGGVLNDLLLAKEPLTPSQRDYGNPRPY